MLSWALTFLVIATIAKVLFVVFLVLFIIGLVMGRRGGIRSRKPRAD